MIYLEGLNSIIESIYLSDGISNKTSNCDIYVNPENVKYLTGKTVIINTINYPIENVDTLIKNRCHIISRVFIDNQNVEIRPYILRVCFNIMWNGKTVLHTETLDGLVEDDYCDFDLTTSTLYFPKLVMYENECDNLGNLTALGWALQQVGVNIKTDTKFINLDIIKTRKIIF